MTIDRAIKREQAKAEEYRAMSSEENAEIAEIYIRCSKYHEQIAEWLEELKFLRQWKSDVMDEFCKYDCNSVEEAMHNGYNKAIDDFAILMKETLNHDWATTKISEQIIYNRLFDKCNKIAEQLKAGEYNE